MTIDPDALKDFLRDSHDLRGKKAKTAEECVRNDCSNGLASTAAGVSSLYAAWCLFRSLQPEKPVSPTQPDLTNVFAANHLSWLCNTAIGIRSLVIQGLEPQARVLLRSFLEATHQTLVLFFEKESRDLYYTGWDNPSSKRAYFETFSKKGRLQKKLKKIEGLASENLTYDGQQQLQERVDALEHYSQATHASFRHILLSGLHPTDGETFADTIMGYPSSSSDNTLLNCSHEIAYFAYLFDYIVKNVWGCVELTETNDYKLFFGMASLAAKFRTHQPAKPNKAEQDNA